MGDPDIITALGKVYVPFTASSLAQAAAIASVNASDELLARTDAVVAERTRVSTALRDAGYQLPASQANFVWLPLGPEHTADFVEKAADARILVRPYGTDGCVSPSARPTGTTPSWRCHPTGSETMSRKRARWVTTGVTAEGRPHVTR